MKKTNYLSKIRGMMGGMPGAEPYTGFSLYMRVPSSLYICGKNSLRLMDEETVCVQTDLALITATGQNLRAAAVSEREVEIAGRIGTITLSEADYDAGVR